jgi:5-(carboxyamino)imidazole ribonucleotide synthase
MPDTPLFMPHTQNQSNPQPTEIKRVGVIGGGQLAWMMAGAVSKLGIELVVQTPAKTDPAVAIASDTIIAAIDDAIATAKLASRCDVITFENEFINLEALKQLEAQGICFRPPLAALAPLLDKYHQRCFLRDINLPVPQFFAIEPGETISDVSFPIVLKARRHGYDGQGTFILKDRDSLDGTLQRLGQTPLLLEEFIPFERELAVIAARSSTGEIVVYPVVETQQEDQVCRRVLVPAKLEASIVEQVDAIARTILDRLQVIGLFGIELFLTTAGKVLVNEVSPRTHNSGHFSLDACETSQFEQHLRAVCGLPLGKVNLSHPCVMVNLLGYEHSERDYRAKRQKIAALPYTYLHWYGKTEARPGRKLGHVTVLLDNSTDADVRDQMLAIARKIESIWYEG